MINRRQQETRNQLPQLKKRRQPLRNLPPPLLQNPKLRPNRRKLPPLNQRRDHSTQTQMTVQRQSRRARKQRREATVTRVDLIWSSILPTLDLPEIGQAEPENL